MPRITTKKSPTLQRIAEVAGISLETVSHILNGTTNKKYSEKTKEKVRKIAQDLNYTPNRASQTMRRGRSNLIGVIHFGSRFRTGQETVSNLPLAISSKGYDYLVNDLQWHGNSPDRVISDLIEHRVEGVILVANVSNLLTASHIERLTQADIPVVSLYGDDDLFMLPLICGDIFNRTFQLTDHLLRIGHRRILMPVATLDTTGIYNTRNTKERISGFKQAIGNQDAILEYSEEEFFSNVPPSQKSKSQSSQGIIINLNSKGNSEDVMKRYYKLALRLYRNKQLPDAIVCTNDQAAFGVFTAALECGFSIPGDVAVVGADNDPFGEYPAFQLTTFQPDIRGACEAAVSTLVEIIHNPSLNKPIKKVFKSQLIVRASCGTHLNSKNHLS